MVKMNYEQFKDDTINHINDKGVCDEGTITVINNMFKTADVNTRRRSGVTTGIKEITRGLPDGPNFSNPNAPVRAGFSSELLMLLAPYYAICKTMGEQYDDGGDVLRAILTPRKSKERTHYSNGAEFAETLVNSMNGVIKAAIKDGTFDGLTEESLVALLEDN
tara:strand:- start:3098 stop:3586 length:489 start_codon:yes stop_codon:yes gene_type:complete